MLVSYSVCYDCLLLARLRHYHKGTHYGYKLTHAQTFGSGVEHNWVNLLPWRKNALGTTLICSRSTTFWHSPQACKEYAINQKSNFVIFLSPFIPVSTFSLYIYLEGDLQVTEWSRIWRPWKPWVFQFRFQSPYAVFHVHVLRKNRAGGLKPT